MAEAALAGTPMRRRLVVPGAAAAAAASLFFGSCLAAACAEGGTGGASSSASSITSSAQAWPMPDGAHLSLRCEVRLADIAKGRLTHSHRCRLMGSWRARLSARLRWQLSRGIKAAHVLREAMLGGGSRCWGRPSARTICWLSSRGRTRTHGLLQPV